MEILKYFSWAEPQIKAVKALQHVSDVCWVVELQISTKPVWLGEIVQYLTTTFPLHLLTENGCDPDNKSCQYFELLHLFKGQARRAGANSFVSTFWNVFHSVKLYDGVSFLGYLIKFSIKEYFWCSKLPAGGGSISHTLVWEEAGSQDTGAGKSLVHIHPYCPVVSMDNYQLLSWVCLGISGALWQPQSPKRHGCSLVSSAGTTDKVIGGKKGILQFWYVIWCV